MIFHRAAYKILPISVGVTFNSCGGRLEDAGSEFRHCLWQLSVRSSVFMSPQKTNSGLGLQHNLRVLTSSGKA
jgi:hypothetical protein